MAAAARDRRHARSVELSIETQVTLQDAAELDAKDTAARKRARTFLDGALDALRTADALDQLEDAKRDRALTLVTELSGLLDGVDLPLVSLDITTAAEVAR